MFAGGCTLDAAEEVADAELDSSKALVQKSLVRHSRERFWMLETIRGYALERLAEQGGAEALRRRHAEWFLAFAERAEPHLEGADQAEWLELLEEDMANIREAAAQPELTGRFLAALRFLWAKRGYVAEGRRLVEDVLPRLADDDPAKRMALVTGSLLAVMQGDFDAAIAHGERAIELGEAAGDVRPGSGGGERARPRAPQCGRGGARARALRGRGRAWPGVRSLGDRCDRAPQPRVRGAGRRELEVADDYLRRAVDLAASCGELHAESRSLAARSAVALEGGRLEDARGLAQQSLAIAAPTHDRDNACWAIELAGCALASADPDRAARLLGAADELRTVLGGNQSGLELAQHDRALSLLAGSLGPEELTAASRRGGGCRSTTPQRRRCSHSLRLGPLRTLSA